MQMKEAGIIYHLIPVQVDKTVVENDHSHFAEKASTKKEKPELLEAAQTPQHVLHGYNINF